MQFLEFVSQSLFCLEPGFPPSSKQSLYYPVVQHLLTVQLLGNYLEPQLSKKVSQSLVSTSFFRCLDFRHLPLFAEAISSHSLLGCDWTSQLHQLTPVDWSQFSRRHRLTTSVTMLLRQWCSSMVPHHLPTLMVSVEQAKLFKTCNSNHQAEKTCLLLKLPFFLVSKSYRLNFQQFVK